MLEGASLLVAGWSSFGLPVSWVLASCEASSQYRDREADRVGAVPHEADRVGAVPHGHDHDPSSDCAGSSPPQRLSFLT